MRLFIAVNFTDTVKDSLCETIRRLQNSALQGNFTRRENLHLTLAFLGETTKIDEIKRSMDQVNTEPFSLLIEGFGKFGRNGGDLFWVGVKNSEKLNFIYTRLWEELSKVGFVPEARAFKPHLTLGREVLVSNSFDRIEFEKSLVPIRMDVINFSLMNSERILGKLTYTEIYSKQLGTIT